MLYYRICYGENQEKVISIVTTTEPEHGIKYYSEEGIYRLLKKTIAKIESLKKFLIKDNDYAFTWSEIQHPLRNNTWFRERKDTILVDPQGIEVGNIESLNYILDTHNIMRTLNFHFVNKVYSVSGHTKDILAIQGPSQLKSKYVNWRARDIATFIKWRDIYRDYSGFQLTAPQDYPLEKFTYEEFLHIVKITNDQFKKHGVQLRERYRNVYLSMALVGIMPHITYYWGRVYTKLELAWNGREWRYV